MRFCPSYANCAIDIIVLSPTVALIVVSNFNRITNADIDRIRSVAYNIWKEKMEMAGDDPVLNWRAAERRASCPSTYMVGVVIPKKPYSNKINLQELLVDWLVPENTYLFFDDALIQYDCRTILSSDDWGKSWKPLSSNVAHGVPCNVNGGDKALFTDDGSGFLMGGNYAGTFTVCRCNSVGEPWAYQFMARPSLLENSD
jgi:hypothetical protein